MDPFFNIRVDNDEIDKLYKAMVSYERIYIDAKRAINNQYKSNDLHKKISDYARGIVDKTKTDEMNKNLRNALEIELKKYVSEKEIDTYMRDISCHYAHFRNINDNRKNKTWKFVNDIVGEFTADDRNNINSSVLTINGFYKTHKLLGLKWILISQWIDPYVTTCTDLAISARYFIDLVDLEDEKYDKINNIITECLDSLDQYYDYINLQKPGERVNKKSLTGCLIDL